MWLAVDTTIDGAIIFVDGVGRNLVAAKLLRVVVVTCPPPRVPTIFLKDPSILENDGHEKEQKHRRTNHRIFAPRRSGYTTNDSCRKHGSNDAPFYKWRRKYRGVNVSEAKQLKELESDDGKLKKLLAEAHLEIHALKRVFGRFR